MLSVQGAVARGVVCGHSAHELLLGLLRAVCAGPARTRISRVLPAGDLGEGACQHFVRLDQVHVGEAVGDEVARYLSARAHNGPGLASDATRRSLR